MLTNEKEYNGYLFDQLSLIEELEEAAETNNIDEVKKVLSKKKRQIERKLYQQPPLSESK
ncbi:MAG: hypothetical protein IJ583_02790 [Firmicutes bacterium]|nr:hypothetical protein [Bacillota bacterium]